MTIFERMVLRALCLVLAGLVLAGMSHTPWHTAGWRKDVRKFNDDVRKLLSEGRL